MGRKGRKKKGSNATPGSQPHISMTLREESRGKRQGNFNAKTMCKLDHLKYLAAWAGSEASSPALGAFFGERLAATTEALGLRAGPSLFACERCESILQPGDNCTVRIEKSKSKMQHRRKKSNPTTQNNVVYRCHFCSHQNLMRGTPKGYLKVIRPLKSKLLQTLEPAKSAVEKLCSLVKATSSIAEINKADTIALPTPDGHSLETSIEIKTGLSLLDAMRRKRNRLGVKKVAEPGTISTAADAEKSIHASSKRRKKNWTSLKEIARSNEHDLGKKKVLDITIPFFI